MKFLFPVALAAGWITMVAFTMSDFANFYAAVHAHDLPVIQATETIIVTGTVASMTKTRAIEALGARVWRIPLVRARLPWLPVLRKLTAMEIVSIMIEGGAEIAGSALKEKIVDKIIFFYAPKILGGDGRSMIGALDIPRCRLESLQRRLPTSYKHASVLVKNQRKFYLLHHHNALHLLFSFLLSAYTCCQLQFANLGRNP